MASLLSIVVVAEGRLEVVDRLEGREVYLDSCGLLSTVAVAGEWLEAVYRLPAPSVAIVRRVF